MLAEIPPARGDMDRDIELILMIVALLMLFSVAIVKAVTTRLIHKIQRAISAANQDKQQATSRLKTVRAQNQVIQKKMTKLENKKKKLRKKFRVRRRELLDIKEERRQRRKRITERKVQVIRSNSDTPELQQESDQHAQIST